jgi:hypothetical protein
VTYPIGPAPGLAEFPTGIVTAKLTTTMTVNVRGVSFSAAWVDLGTNTPVVGDQVILGRQDSTWIVIGRQGGVGGNQVANFSFEQDGAITSTPTSWNRAVIAGTGLPAVLATGFAPDGTYELGVTATGGVAQDTYIYSNPINVAPGQVWALSALASAVYPFGAAVTATAGVYGLWFANDTNLYPTTSAADTLAASATVGPAPVHSGVSGTVTVPAATTFMRVGLRSGTAADVTVLWDLVVARRLS